MPEAAYVYILASRKNGTLYVGVTSDLQKRVWQHRESEIEGFTMRYGVKSLAYFEIFDRIDDAIAREKQLKNWKRAWKIQLIEKENPGWADLYATLF